MDANELDKLAAEADEKHEQVKMLERIKPPVDPEERKKAFTALQVARREELLADKALIEMVEIILKENPEWQDE